MARVRVKSGPHRPLALSPALSLYPDLWGIYVGDGCVTGETPLLWREIDAHAHNSVEDEWFGWVCIADPYNVITASGQPTVLLKHEIAHILCKNSGHDKRWRMVLTAMGAESEAKKYEKKKNDEPGKG